MFEQAPPLPVHERCLTEVDSLNQFRLPDGRHDPRVLTEQLLNLITGTQEAAMPQAVSNTEHYFMAYGYDAERGQDVGTYMWQGKTSVQNAASGYRYHKHLAAHARVAIEVDEAYDTDATLRPGIAKVFISPQMTRFDAPLEVAEAEHLAGADAVRVSFCKANEYGQIQSRLLQSLLVREVPLEAWVALLRDPANIFGRVIEVADNGSALPVMAAHRELELPMAAVPEGPVSMIEAVLPYIRDAETRSAVRMQLDLYRGDQAVLQERAVNIARRWQKFEIALADSLHSGQATFEIERFITTLQCQWGAEDLNVITAHARGDGHYNMSRSLAVVVEKAKQNTLWNRASVVTGNQKVIDQMDPRVVQQIIRDELFMQLAEHNGYNMQQLQSLDATTDRLTASQNATTGGGGCPGTNKPTFESGNSGPDQNTNKSGTSPEDKKNWKYSDGVCIVPACPTRPRIVKLGPCKVCIGRCQEMYDAGDDPTKQAGVRTKAAAAMIEHTERPEKSPDLKQLEAAPFSKGKLALARV